MRMNIYFIFILYIFYIYDYSLYFMYIYIDFFHRCVSVPMCEHVCAGLRLMLRDFLIDHPLL